MARRLGPVFYRRDDVVAVARDLVGKVLCTAIDGRVTKAILIETEAYAGTRDRASHTWGGRRTRRTEPLYAPGGVAYVYLCYGIHYLFNAVAGSRDMPQGILARAGVPFAGLDTMLERRGRHTPGDRLLAGPGSLTRALGIHTRHSGTPLTGLAKNDRVWIEDHGIEIAAADILCGPRIGVDYAGEDAALPYRFRVPAATVLRG